MAAPKFVKRPTGTTPTGSTELATKAYVDTLVGGEYRATAAQTFPAWAGNKLTFGTTVQAASGITWNGTNMFTVVTAGLYTMTAFCGVTANASNHFLFGIGKTALTGSGATGELYTGWLTASGNQEEVTVSATRLLAAGDTICVWVYINGGAPGAPLPSGTNFDRAATLAVWKGVPS